MSTEGFNPDAPQPGRWVSASIERIAVEIMRWQRKQFGTKQSVEGPLAHLRKELAEIEKDPSDVIEWVDFYFLFLNAMHRRGIDPMYVMGDAAFAKLVINQHRKWGEPGPDGAIEHVRERPTWMGAHFAPDQVREFVNEEGGA